MAKTFSFDIESSFDLSAMINAVDQVKRELATRYDFGGSGAKIEFIRDKNLLELEANSEPKIKAILDVIKSKLIKAGISLKTLDTSSRIELSGLVYKLATPLVQGLDQDKAKPVTKLIRDNFPKAKAQIIGQSIRVTSTSKDELQTVITKLRATEFDFPLNFTNFR